MVVKGFLTPKRLEKQLIFIKFISCCSLLKWSRSKEKCSWLHCSLTLGLTGSSLSYSVSVADETGVAAGCLFSFFWYFLKPKYWIILCSSTLIILTWQPPLPWPPAHTMDLSSTCTSLPLTRLQSLWEATGSMACWRVSAALPPPTVRPHPAKLNKETIAFDV